MPYRVCKTIDVENGHMLSKHPGKCRFPHGHTRKVEFVLEAEALNQNEMVCDFLVVKELIADYLEVFDHAICVNSADPGFPELRARYGESIVAFENEDPTTEVMAREIFKAFAERLAKYIAGAQKFSRLGQNTRLVSVRVWETASSWAEYAP